MKVSLLPENEKERLEELRSYQIMDSEPEQDFDDLVELASQLCDSPIALITLIDENRQWIKAKIGVDISETTRDIAFCAHAIHDNDIMIIRDATQDDRFFDNPLVAEDPKVRFYAGMPLITDKGFKLGTLCVFDQKPKDLSDLQLNALRILGKQVVNLLDLRVRNLELKKQVQEKTTEIKDAFARDIIERKHNEESLQEAEVRYRTIFDNSIDGIYQTTPEGRFMLVNPALAKIFGYASPEEIINAVSDIGAQLYADPQDRLNQKILLAKDGKAMGSEFRVFKKNKEIIWVHDNIRAVYNSKGRIQYFEGTLKDITDRKEAEEKQRQAEQRYSMVVASMAEGMILFDQDGVMTDCNASAEKILSITAAQMKGQATNPSWKATGEDGSPITINNYPALVALGTGEEQRGKIMKLDKADGSFLWLSINALPIFDGENPKPTGVFATFIDITERKKAERVILESKEALERSEEQAKLGSWYVEVATGKRYWSKQLFRTFELDPLSEIPSFEDNLKRYHPDDRSLLKAAFEKVLRDEECEPIIIRTNPVLLPLRYLLHSWLCHRDAAGQPVKFEGTVLDITERKEAEENYRNIFENSLDGIYQTTPDGKLIIANPSTAKILGYVSVEELMASISDVGTQLYADPQDRDKMRDLLAQKGKVLGFEFKALNKGKEVIWLRANTQAICDEQGKIKHYEGSLRDITDRKEVEAQLIKEKDLAISIINSLPGVFYLFNSVGKYLRWNKNFETITGYTGEEIANLHPSEFFEEGEERDRVVARIGEVFTKGFAEVETNFFTKDKRKIPYYFNGWKIEYENQTCLIGVGIDIAHRKKAVDELRESEIYLRGILDSTTDGILAIDTNGKVISSNNRFKELWHIPEELMALKDDHALLTYVLGQLVDPEEFLRKVEDLYRSDRTDFDILQFKDGRIFERQYNPLVLNKNKVGKVWSFRDATERKKNRKKIARFRK